MAQGSTRKSEILQLKDMNGDHLLKLKRPIASEMTREVQGSVAGHAQTMKKKLNLLYKERNIALDKVKRRQDEVFATLLRVHKDRKLLQREAYKRRQEELRSLRGHVPPMGKGLGEQSSGEDQKVISEGETKDQQGFKDDSSRIETEGDDKRLSRELAEGLNQEGAETGKGSSKQQPSSPTRGVRKRARVVEISRRNQRLEPITREKSVDSQEDIIQQVAEESRLQTGDSGSSGNFPNVRKHMLPETQSDLASDELVLLPKVLPDLKVPKASTKAPPPRAYLLQKLPPQQSQGEGRLSTIAETEVRSADRLALSDGSLSHSTPELHVRTGSLDSSPSRGLSVQEKNMTQVQRNKLEARRRYRRQMELLKSDEVPLYIRNKRGEIVPSLVPFRRQKFTPPSFREKYFQKKALGELRDRGLQLQIEAAGFFGKLADDGK